MPLAMSRGTINTWTPNGGIATVNVNGSFKKGGPAVGLLPDPVYLPQKAPVKSIFNGHSRGMKPNRPKSAALQAIELSLKPYRNDSANGFAEPKPFPFSQDTPVKFKQPEVQVERLAVALPPSPPPASRPAPPSIVQSPTNQNVHFVASTGSRRHRFGVDGVSTPVKSVCPDASVQCASALFLATESSQSIGHLRKWNSQSYLASQDLSPDPDLLLPERPALRRNASLPDLRLAEQLDATGLHRARPRNPVTNDALQKSPLMRSPSDMGRSLCFWVENEEKIKAFHEIPATRRAKYEQKISLYRRHKEDSVSNPEHIYSKPKYRGLSRPNSPQVVVTSDSDMLTLSPQLLAQELTQLGRELLLAVEPAELLTYVMKPRMAEMDTCPNLHRLLQFYERLSALITSEILRNQSANSRAQMLARFVETANHCYDMQNWQSCRALLAGIRSPPIVRLKDTWLQFRTEFSDHFSMFSMLVMNESAEEESSPESLEVGQKPRPLAAVPYFGEIVARVRARPTIQRLRPARALWKEPPSLAKWVDEQTSVATECDQCQSRSHKNRACCYLMVFVMGKNFFCPIRRMPLDDVDLPNLNGTQEIICDSDNNVLQRLHLAQIFDDPDTLPFTSNLVQCCALQPGNIAHIRQRVEILLRSAQATARAYDLDSNPTARHYWLHQPYSNMVTCLKRSMAIEPQTTTKVQKPVLV